MSGYIGPQPVPQATQHREAFTAAASQTSFATAGYTPQFIDVYLNGVKLAPADYTATNGSDIVLTTGAAASDILEYVAYTPFEVANQTFTGTTTTDALTVTGAFTSKGIDDNAAATAMTLDASGNVLVGQASGTAPGVSNTTVGHGLNNLGYAAHSRTSGPSLYLNRNSTDGVIASFQRDGTTVGSIGVLAADEFYIDGVSNSSGIGFLPDRIVPRNSGVGYEDATQDIGQSNIRYKDLYLSGGVYLGGTGAANKLDDYEEGTWTPALDFGGSAVGITYAARVGKYTKVGNLVTASCYVKLTNKGSSGGGAQVSGWPFAAENTASTYFNTAVWINSITYSGTPQAYIGIGQSLVGFSACSEAGVNSILTNANFINNSDFMLNVSYRTP